MAFLRHEGAAKHTHAGGRTLLEHLIGTYEIVRRWNQPSWLQHAALIHSVYGTDAHPNALLAATRRSALASLAGERAERIAYLFCVTPTPPLIAGTYKWAPKVATVTDGPGAEPHAALRGELDAVLLLHLANLAEQARSGDGSPGIWLVKLHEPAELLIDSDTVEVPPFVAALAQVSEGDERIARRAYRTALGASEGAEPAESRLALAAATCPAVAEPCIWQAYHASRRGDAVAARAWAGCARRRLIALGTAWDKRLAYEDWLQLTHVLERPGPQPAWPEFSDPRLLYEAVVRDRVDGPPEPETTVGHRPSTPEGRARFLRYMDGLAEADGSSLSGVYPDLGSRPWYQASAFSVAGYLESHFEEIREELLKLDPAQFRPESERIPRAGDWDVVFFYERGRRHEEVCAACPVTTRGIDGEGTMRTAAGLIYLSRMRAGTHISAHRGPTNLRLRCHLGIAVPEGDCAIRVGDETRTWTEGQCMVFDDHFEHEAWNHTAEDRIVLIVDLWHPELTNDEVELLAGLHRFAHGYGRQLSRYWAANAAAAAGSAKVP